MVLVDPLMNRGYFLLIAALARRLRWYAATLKNKILSFFPADFFGAKIWVYENFRFGPEEKQSIFFISSCGNMLSNWVVGIQTIQTWRWRTESYSNQNHQKQQFWGENSFGIHLQTFP